MTPVDQTRFYDPTLPVHQQRGNCLQAVIASLLDLPLDTVPHFVQDHVDTDGARNWWNTMIDYVRSHGWGLHGATLETHPGEHLMVSGPSPRGAGVHHVVIYRDRVMVHDPHPDRTGLLSVDACWGLHRLDNRDARA